MDEQIAHEEPGEWMDEARRLWRTGDGSAVSQWWRALSAEDQRRVTDELMDFSTSLGTAIRETGRKREERREAR